MIDEEQLNKTLGRYMYLFTTYFYFILAVLTRENRIIALICMCLVMLFGISCLFDLDFMEINK